MTTRRLPWPSSGHRALDALNSAFHDTYDEARDTSDDGAPILAVSTDALVLFRGAWKTSVAYSPPEVHAIKAIAHAPVALFAVVSGNARGFLIDSVEERLLRSRQQTLTTVDRATIEIAREVLEASITFAGRVRAAPDDARAASSSFARRMGPRVLALTERATAMQLEALDREVARLLEGIPAEERRVLHVVVMGDHQARDRSLGMQYFEKLLAGEDVNRRLTYAEGISEAEEARTLVRTQRIDRAIATAFFEDPERLQRDVLGDAAKKILRTFVPTARAE